MMLTNSPSSMAKLMPFNTGNLDSKTGREILELLGQLNDDGMTIVMVTHDESVSACTKRIVRILDGVVESDEVVNNGRCSFDGQPEQEADE